MPLVREEVPVFGFLLRCVTFRYLLLSLAGLLAPLLGPCFLWKFECCKSGLRGVPKLSHQLPKLRRCKLFEML
jgi:hypothetical protein